MRTTTSKMLAMDEQIDKLSDEAIKDIWVRQALFKRKRNELRRIHSDRPQGPYGTDEFEQMKTELTIGENERNLYQFLQRTDIEYRKALHQSDQSPEEYLWDVLTVEDADEAEKIETARDRLKAACEGCGMPHITMIKESVRKYAEIEDDTR